MSFDAVYRSCRMAPLLGTLRWTYRRLTYMACLALPLIIIYLYIYLAIRDKSKLNIVSLSLHSMLPEQLDGVDVDISANLDYTSNGNDFYSKLYASNQIQSQTNLLKYTVREHVRGNSVASRDTIFRIGRMNEHVDCAAIFLGNQTEIRNAKYSGTYSSSSDFGPEHYINMTSDCSNFIKERNYIMESLSEEESNFSIAYSILIYKDIEQFDMLLRAIYRPEHHVCIHVDLIAEYAFFRGVTAIAECLPNVYMIQNRVNVIWGQMSVLTPELLCMKLLHAKSTLWKYFINLTGQEFPLRTNYELVKILTAYNGANDVEAVRRSSPTFKTKAKNRWLGHGDPPHGITPTKGMVHAVLSRAFVNYTLHDRRAQDLLRWVEKTVVPDETYFATLNHNPHLQVPGSYAGDTENVYKPVLSRFKNWGDFSCRGTWRNDLCIFGVGDLPSLALRPELFVNKFLWSFQRTAFTCMAELLYNRTRDQHLGRLGFDAGGYGRLPFVINQTRVGD